ncbi:dethiobiotin synthase [Roseateles sp. BYS180W]|uniref:ATP-dependent dethiobiotin synthetase BioD n=1 Tax=Roseateles rivi TaxID=3299028 RepID=A0ABW7FWW6_9BURK
MKGLFITGTDTEIGKTCITAALTHALQNAGARVVPIKPLAAGQTQDEHGQWVNEDVAQLHAAQNAGLSLAQVGPLQLREACAPHIAARLEGQTLEREAVLSAIRASSQLGELALVEGVGGFRVPLNEHYDTADLAQDLALPVLLVVGLRLGCINHALLTAEALRARGLRLLGWVANTVDPAQTHVGDNIAALHARLGAPLWGHIPRLEAPTPAAVAAHFAMPAADLLQQLRSAQTV